MKRREFLLKGGCGLAAAGVFPMAAEQEGRGQQEKPLDNRDFTLEIEIYEAREDTWCHHKGEKFRYPQDWGKLCPWLRSSMQDFIRILEYGGHLRWDYGGTPYEKVIDINGVTTEYVRCPDPTADLVVKIIRTRKTG